MVVLRSDELWRVELEQRHARLDLVSDGCNLQLLHPAFDAGGDFGDPALVLLHDTVTSDLPAEN